MDNCKAWIKEFLFTRELFQGPQGEPLYSYQVTAGEFQELIELLAHANLDKHPPKGLPDYTGAAFCLLVAEYYRRKYTGEFAVKPIEDLISQKISQQDRAQLTLGGLAFWRREPLKTESRISYLGSLFAEGGLPWPLLNSDTHGFGRAIRRGIGIYYKIAALDKSLTSLMLEHQDELPQVFRNIHTAKLLSGIVERLTKLTETYPLREVKNPAEYLDEHAKGWNKDFPIPLDIENGRRLINDWLRQAEKSRHRSALEKKRQAELLSEFTSDNYFQLSNRGVDVTSEVVIPRELKIKRSEHEITSTRFEPLIYEGNRLIFRGSPIYASLDQQQECIQLAFKRTRIEVKRSDCAEPLTFKLVSHGSIIFNRTIENSLLDLDASPLFLTEQADRWYIAGSDSCSIAESSARLWLPKQCQFGQGESAAKLIQVYDFGTLYELSSSALITNDNNDEFEIQLCTAQPRSFIRVIGHETNWSTLPITTYFEFPKLNLSDDANFALEDLRIFVNDRRVLNLNHLSNIYGRVQLVIKDNLDKTLFRRTFGVVPHDLKIQTRPARAETPAFIKLMTSARCKVTPNVANGAANYAFIDELDAGEFSLTTRDNKAPVSFHVDVCSDTGSEPVTLRVPFPVAGARIITPDGEAFEGTSLLLDGLLGHRIQLTNSSDKRQRFSIALNVMSKGQVKYQKDDVVFVEHLPIEISLFGMHREITKLLGNLSDQDAVVQLVIQLGQSILKRVVIQRYNAYLERDGHELVTKDYDGNDVRAPITLRAINISNPEQQALSIEPILSAETPTGRYAMDKLIDSATTWIVHSNADSELKVRPYVQPGDGVESLVESADLEALTSLHSACNFFHPIERPSLIREQIEKMATDYNHSGWDYLSILKQKYGHLPLSSFEAWRALGRNSDALALAVFRLELDSTFCERISDELAVVWEFTPVDTWRAARTLFANAIMKLGVPESYVDITVREREVALKDIVSAFEYLTEYLQTGDAQTVRQFPYEMIILGWYQELRRFFAENDNWPIDLSHELKAFVMKSNLGDGFKQVSNIGYTDAVVYLPMFVACVTAGLTGPKSLCVPTSQLKFAMTNLSDFGREMWFRPVHAATTAYLIAKTNNPN
ncbi:STY4851/ECs_5259 family protein [Pseudidiomarina aquimaris]|uniref:STY4851/ECs_5259 family protein n=1 Tax=Pseudidiomarina aquimaris TaxID=641841 RepID=UPI003A96C381